ncbi:homoserine kinase [Actinocorallia sp. API 0066]|uniref:homoserine kinase n=1 Tax=Actinocorallia sp. API 0066 TaxID=2896846 RepID=UPI001E561CE8|nr:homoserine kinase [Actinocorallia sp. API 0066]MCD0451312.1 homoserine kinase [Actinocorallia sp. API 0066]
MSDSVTVEVPATSANLGPGFDSLGLALTYHDEVTVETASSGVEISIEGEGQELASLGEEHLIVQVFRRAWERIGPAAAPGGVRLHCVNRIPHSRGMGSSSAAIVAGITAARALHPAGGAFSDDAAFALATEIEGHPDNVAPCLAGGLTIAWTRHDGPRLVRLDLDAPVTVFVPDQRLATERARGLLPASVSHADAAANSARAALLIAALTSKLGYDVLLDATEDRLHQSYRAPAMPGSAALVERLRRAGVPAVVSGAGPTVLAFGWPTVGWPQIEAGKGWDMHQLNVSPFGARVQPRDSRTR